MNLLIPFFGLPRPIFYFLLGHLLSFVGLLTIIPAILAQWSLFYHSLSPSFSYCWASSAIRHFCQKWASTFSPLSIWIAPAVHMRIYIYIYNIFFFHGFFWPVGPALFSFLPWTGCLFEFPNLAVILKHKFYFINTMLLLAIDPLPPFTSLLLSLIRKLFPFPSFAQNAFFIPLSSPCHLPQNLTTHLPRSNNLLCCLRKIKVLPP